MSTAKSEALKKQLEAAKERVKQLKARQAAIEARERAKESKQRRAEDTRRKILIGAYVLSNFDKAQIQKMMSGYLKEDRDRELFGLPLIARGESMASPEAAGVAQGEARATNG